MDRFGALFALLTIFWAQSAGAGVSNIKEFKKLLFCGVKGPDSVVLGNAKGSTDEVVIDGKPLSQKSYEEFVAHLKAAGVPLIDQKVADDAAQAVIEEKANEGAAQMQGAGAKMDAAMANPEAAAGDKMSPEARAALKDYQAKGGMPAMPGLPPGVKLPPGFKMPGMPGGMSGIPGMPAGGVQGALAQAGKKGAAAAVERDQEGDADVSAATAKVASLCKPDSKSFPKLMSRTGADGILFIQTKYVGYETGTSGQGTAVLTTTTTAYPILDYTFEYYDQEGKPVTDGFKQPWRSSVEKSGDTAQAWIDGYMKAIPKVTKKFVDKIYQK